MSFFRFLSLVSLPILFFGNVVAECVDLSGTYLCENDEVVISRDLEGEGIFAYSMTEEKDGNKVTSPLLEILVDTEVTTECTENWIKTENRGIRQDLSVAHKVEVFEGGDIISSVELRRISNGALIERMIFLCNRQLL